MPNTNIQDAQAEEADAKFREQEAWPIVPYYVSMGILSGQHLFVWVPPEALPASSNFLLLLCGWLHTDQAWADEVFGSDLSIPLNSVAEPTGWCTLIVILHPKCTQTLTAVNLVGDITSHIEMRTTSYQRIFVGVCTDVLNTLGEYTLEAIFS